MRTRQEQAVRRRDGELLPVRPRLPRPRGHWPHQRGAWQ